MVCGKPFNPCNMTSENNGHTGGNDSPGRGSKGSSRSSSGRSILSDLPDIKSSARSNLLRCFCCPVSEERMEIQSLVDISNIIEEEEKLDRYRFEPQVIRKSLSAVKADWDDERYPRERPPAIVEERLREREVSFAEEKLAEALCSSLNGRVCSYVKRTDKQTILGRRRHSLDSPLRILSDVNTVIQNHLTNRTIGDSCKATDTTLVHPKEHHRTLETTYDDDDYFAENAENVERMHDFLRESFDNSVPECPVQGEQEGTGALSWKQIRTLSIMDSYAMLDNLPSLSGIIRKELCVDDLSTLHHIELLDYIFKIQYSMRRKPKLIEDRWVVFLYTDIGPSASSDYVREFQYHIVRLILLTYCVAFEERNVNSEGILHEFASRFKAEEFEVRLPFVFSRGVSVGSYDVIYTLHNQRLLSTIFKYSILTPTQFRAWTMRTPNTWKYDYKLQVSRQAVPRLSSLLEKETRNVELQAPGKAEAIKQLEACVVTIKHSVEYWDEQMSVRFWAPDLRTFVLLRNTVRKAVSLLECILIRHFDVVKGTPSSSTNSGREKVKKSSKSKDRERCASSSSKDNEASGAGSSRDNDKASVFEPPTQREIDEDLEKLNKSKKRKDSSKSKRTANSLLEVRDQKAMSPGHVCALFICTCRQEKEID